MKAKTHFVNTNLATKTDIEMLRKDMTIKMGAMAFATITILGVLITL